MRALIAANSHLICDVSGRSLPLTSHSICDVVPLLAALAGDAVLRMTREASGVHACTSIMALAHNDNAATTAVTSSAFAESTSQAEHRCLGTLSIDLQLP